MTTPTAPPTGSSVEPSTCPRKPCRTPSKVLSSSCGAPWVRPTRMTFKQLINPHSHSESSLDGASTIESIVTKNAALGATHVCSTEHGNLNSAMEMVMECSKKKVKPILGIELYMVPPY